MKSNHILLILASIVILAAIAYMFTAAESPEDYQEKIETERERGGEEHLFVNVHVTYS